MRPPSPAPPRRVFVFEYLSAAGAAGSAHDAELLPQGLAMRDALLADLAGVPGLTLRHASGPNVPPAAAAPAGAVVPRPEESLLDFVRREAVAHDAMWVVAPESAGLLEALHGAVGARRWIGCSRAALACCASKRATLAALAAAGIATPLAFETEARHWVVKPDDGAGATDTHRHARRALAEAECKSRGAAATLEPWVEGEPMSLSLLVRGAAGAELLAVNRQLIEVDPAGAVRYCGVRRLTASRHDAHAPALAALAGRIAQAVPGLSGYVGVDLVWHAARGPVVIEINPRLTSAYVGLSAALGRNVAAEVLALERGGHGAG